MYRIIFSAYRWGRAIRPPAFTCPNGKSPADFSTEKIHIFEKGHNRALCGFVPFSKWEELDNPDLVTPICQRCLHTAIGRSWVIDQAVKPKKRVDRYRKIV